MPRQATRVAVLLVLLAIAVMWASSRTSARRARTSWAQPVQVAVLVLGAPSAAGMARLGAALDDLARRLAADRARYDPGATGAPFVVELVGPLRAEREPPMAPPAGDPIGRGVHAFELWRATRAAHAAAPGFVPDAWDVRVYVVAAPGGEDAPLFAEGLGEQGGEVGLVRARFDERGALLAASAVFHEVFHCLGASDKYDAGGHAVVPAGLAEPDLVPPFPQRMAELMVGEVPLGPARGRLPATADEVAVGPVTAAEVGWRQAAATPIDGR